VTDTRRTGNTSRANNGTTNTSNPSDNGSVPGAKQYRRKSVYVSNRNPIDASDEVIELVMETNGAKPKLFKMGSTAVRVELPNGGTPGKASVKKDEDAVLVPYGPDDWLRQSAGLADFIRRTANGETIVNPPASVMRMVPPGILPRLPQLDGVVRFPFLRADGTIVDTDGYDSVSRLYLLTNGLELPLVPKRPTKANAAAALELIVEGWLGDFPFAQDGSRGKDGKNCSASRTHAVAALQTVTGRAFFTLSPVFVGDASVPGAGKGLLADTLSVIAYGFPAHLLQLPPDDAEQRKTMTSALLNGHDVLVFDESPDVAGRALALLATAEIYSDRRLGVSQLVTVRNRFTILTLGNNSTVWGDMRRRVVPIRLEPEDEHPERRSNFRHPELRSWVTEQRGELLAASFILWLYWMAQGRPKPTGVTMGSYESWVHAVGGCLQAAGLDGFLTNIDEWLAVGNPDNASWEPHLRQLAERMEPTFTVKDVATKVQLGEIELPYTEKDLPNDPGRLAHAIGNLYRKGRDRWWGNYCLRSSATLNSSSGTRTWSVIVRPSHQKSAERPNRSQKSQESQ
jgi:hypothetical protein